MTPRLLTVCPTRERAEMCRIMLRSFLSTRSEGTEIFFYVDELDPQRNIYQKMSDVSMDRIRFEFGPRKTIVEVFNYALEKFPAEYYADCNDDFIYHTNHWDQRLINALLAHGNHGMACGRIPPQVYKTGEELWLPGAAVYPAQTLRKLGWWFPPQFRHLYIDNVHGDLFGTAGLICISQDVWIEHLQEKVRANPDNTYKGVYTEEMVKHDIAAYEEWLAGDFQKDLKRLMS